MNNHWIYVIGDTASPYKIGFTKDPDKRLKTLQTGNPKKLQIHYKEQINENEVKYIEKQIHNELKRKQVSGEWFNISLDDAISEVKYAVMRYTKVE